jgi:FkbM family methyltransferase
MNTIAIKLRSIGRRIGLHHLVYRTRAALKLNQGYEEHLHRALEKTVKPGDVVWDIGANVGIYTELFCKWVGPEGRVVAFEPNPEPFARMQQRLLDCPWLTLENVALGPRDELSTLVIDGAHTSGHVLRNDLETKQPGNSLVSVQVTTGDNVCRRIGKCPTVLKIDVEGFEEEVLLGFEHTLLSPALRAVVVEVHFQILESRGQPAAAIRIEKLLKSKGFRLKWIDSNHLLADRAAGVALEMSASAT